jgi:uncharacterized protein (DUF111 family)
MGAHLHFDCYSGISGDMTLGALVDVGVPFPDLVRGLKGLRLSGFTLRKRRVHRAAIHATKVDVVITSGLRKPLSLHRRVGFPARSSSKADRCLIDWLKRKGMPTVSPRIMSIFMKSASWIHLSILSVG